MTEVADEAATAGAPEWISRQTLWAALVITLTTLCYYLVKSKPSGSTEGAASTAKEEEEEEEKEEPRDFTPAQLRRYDGTKPADRGEKGFDAHEPTKIYVAMMGEVFDVTAGADFYGVDGSYHLFAGRDASRALAKLSFEDADLDDPHIDDLNAGERDTLNDWYDKFKNWKSYPIVGRLSAPPTDLQMSESDLRQYDGTGEAAPGRLHAPIYIAVRGEIFDMSYGGLDFYKVIP